jgi:hypothetical protein
VSSGAASCTTGTVAAAAYSVTAAYSGDTNYASSQATTSFAITPDPVLDVTTSGTPSGASVGTSYTLTLHPSLGSSGGPAYHNPTLTATLPTGETFAAAPIPSGWSCSLGTGDAVLTCTASSAPITAGTTLTGVTATVDISSTTSGSLQTAVALTDSPDLATAANATPAVDVTATPLLQVATSGTPSGAAAGASYSLTLSPSLGGSPAGPAYNAPTLTATLPAGETFAAAPGATGWSCGLSGGGEVLTCTATSTPIAAGATLAGVTATVEVSSTAPLEALATTATLADTADLASTATASALVDVTADPVLDITTSGTPSAAAAGSSYSLTLSPSLGASPGGPAHNAPTLTATLPPGETFEAAPTVTGWSCSLSGGSQALTCTSSSTSITAGTSLAGVTATVEISSAAPLEALETTASLADTADLATTASSSASVDVTATPVLDLSTAGTPAAAAAGTGYSLALSPSLGASPAGPAYNDPTLLATLPAGETFASVPSASGWSCALSVELTLLSCTASSAPVAAGTALDGVTATVDISASSGGMLESSAFLTDSADAATPVIASASLDVTADPVLQISTAGTPAGAAAGTSYSLTLSPSLGASPAGPAYSDPTLTATLPAGETFAAAPSAIGWSCSLNTTGTALTCTASSAPITAGTTLAAVTATVDISPAASETLRTAVSLADSSDAAAAANAWASVEVTAPPALHIATTGTPAAAAAGTSYTLTLSPSLGAYPAGPAYTDPTLTATLPTGETFAAAPTATGWSCALSAADTVVTCTSSLVPIPAGTALPSLTATVEAGATAAGTLTTTAGLADSADLAAAGNASAAVDITADPMLDITTAGTPSGAAAGTSYSLTLSPSLGVSPAGPAYNDPTLTATLPSGETFAAAPAAPGWDCALTVSDSVLTCTSSLAPIAAGTVLSGVTAKVDIASTALGTLQTTVALADSADAAATARATGSVDVTAPPVLDVSTSGTPITTPQGSSYTLSVSVTLSGSGGPAYGEPTLTFTLPSGEAFAAAVSVSGWSCSLGDGDTTLTCVRAVSTPVEPGASLVSLSVQVLVGPTASGTLAATVSASDNADLAAEAAVVAMTTVPVGTPDTGAPAAAAYPWALGALLAAAGLLLVIGEEGRRRSHRSNDRA